MDWFSAKRIWQIIAALASLAAAVGTFTLPIFASSDGSRMTAFEVTGSSLVIVTGIPIILTLLPLAFRSRAWVITGYIAALGMIAYTVTGILSVGLLFLPAAILSVIGAFWRADPS